MRFLFTILLFPALSGALLAQTQDAPPVRHQLTLGAYHSEGDYGVTRDTTITFLPLSYEISRFPWILSVTVPYLSLDGPGDVFLETGNIARRGSTGDAVSAKGLGDVTIAGTYQFDPIFNDFAFLDFTLEVKAPTADEQRDLGTGETDLSLQFDLYKALNDITLFTTVGYRRRGKTPLYDLRDNAFLSLGALRDLAGPVSIGVLYDYRERASSNSVESHELMPFVSWEAGESWELMFYTVAGFTDSSADRAFGIQASYHWQ